MSTGYVGLSTPEGTCEAVEVDLPKPTSAERKPTADQFVLAGSMNGITRYDPISCMRDFCAAIGTVGALVLGAMILLSPAGV